MTFAGLSATWVVAGLGLLALALFALHLLRVRLRRVAVDSLLFFRQVAQPLQPRVLRGAPSRLLSYLLSLAILAALLLAFADPWRAETNPSRVVLVDGSGSAAHAGVDGRPLLAAHLDHARELAATEGLGPRGSVFLVAGELTPLLAAGEAPHLLAARAAGRVPTGSHAHFESALLAARGRLRAGDEIVVVGGPQALPETMHGVRVARACPAPGESFGAPAAASPAALEPIAVHVAGAVPPAVALALASDPELRQVEVAAEALVTVADARAALPASPALRIEDGAGSGPREAQRTPRLPFPLSLRDLRRTDAPALLPEPGETVWIEDARSGAPLVAARRDPARDGAPTVRIVRWLVEDLGHADVPRLVLHAVRVVAAPRLPPVCSAGTEIAVPALDGAVADLRGPVPLRLLPSQGVYRFAVDLPGTYRLELGRRHAEFRAVPVPAAPAGAAETTLAALGGTRLWLPLALLALALMAFEAWLYHRGRVP
ncbi:MAG: hypothetical protein IT458_18210 [Planctomycetes bacterium]|nr:hypothetical protein [Planctomycetota bacterium]